MTPQALDEAETLWILESQRELHVKHKKGEYSKLSPFVLLRNPHLPHVISLVVVFWDISLFHAPLLIHFVELLTQSILRHMTKVCLQFSQQV